MSKQTKQVLSSGEIFEHIREVMILMEAFETLPSIKAVVDECATGLQQKGYAFDIGELEAQIENEALWQGQVRHEAPWFSEGIRAELKAMGCPVTIAESLDEAFCGCEGEIKDLIEKYGLEEAPYRLEDLWGHDHGYFYIAYDEPEMIFESWQRLGIIDKQGNLIQ